MNTAELDAMPSHSPFSLTPRFSGVFIAPVGDGSSRARARSPQGSRFPCPLHSFRTVGFPQYGWKSVTPERPFRSVGRAFDRSSALSGSLASVQAFLSPSGAIALQPLPVEPLADPQALGSGRVLLPLPSWLLRPDPPVSGAPGGFPLRLYRPVFVPSGPRQSPSLLCLDRPSRRATALTPSEFPSPGIGAFTKRLAVRPPSCSTRIGFMWAVFTRQQHSLKVAARRVVRTSGPTTGDLRPRPGPFTAELARLRVSPVSSLLWLLGSIIFTEAGLSPAGLSKDQGCTTVETVRTQPPYLTPR
jgi:hypothetical protein